LGIIVSREEGEEKGKGKGKGKERGVGDDEEDDVRTPIRPSAKALGKRRVVEAEEPDRKSSARITLVTSSFDIFVCVLAQQTRSIPTTCSTNVRTSAAIRGTPLRTIVG
jgi:hypothetical protein